MTKISAEEAYKRYPERARELDYLTGKLQSFDMTNLNNFFLQLRSDGILLNVAYMDVMPGSGVNPFYCNGVQQHYK